VAALLLAGCGIRETDVIEAGGPANVPYVSDYAVQSLLFFRLPHGELVPVVRALGSYEGANYQPRPASPEKVLTALLGGPTKKEKAVGLSTALPPVTGGSVRLRGSAGAVGPGDGPGSVGGDVTLSLPLPLAPLDATAVRQLICTAAYNKDRDGRATVRITGTDGGTKSGTCDLDSRLPQGVPEP
jgi:hypothetical protein